MGLREIRSLERVSAPNVLPVPVATYVSRVGEASGDLLPVPLAHLRARGTELLGIAIPGD